MPPASLKDSRSAGRSGPGSFQITASALCPGAYEILCAPFKCGVSISPNPLGLLKVISTGLQSQTFWGLIFPVQDPQAGPSHSFGRTFAIVIILLFVSHPPRGMGPDYIATLPLLLVLLWFLLYILYLLYILSDKFWSFSSMVFL